MIITSEIIFDLFSFLDKDRIERVQLVNQFWNNVVIRHKNILPLRQFNYIKFSSNEIDLCVTGIKTELTSYIINFDGTNLSKSKKRKEKSSWYSQLTVDEVLKNLNDVVFHTIQTGLSNKECPDNLLNLMKLVSTKTEGRFRGRFGCCFEGRFSSTLAEIYDNYIIVDELVLGDYSTDSYRRFGPDYSNDSYIRDVCANPETVQLPSTSKEIKLGVLKFRANDEVSIFTCNGKLNTNRLIIDFETSDYGNFIRQWFELYRTHQNPFSLAGKFELKIYVGLVDSVLDAVKTFLNSAQLRVTYSLETKEFRCPFNRFIKQYVKRSCVLHETDSYALVIEMSYGAVTDMSSINASDLDQPPRNQMKIISFCVKSL